jgi:hypothetical protein
VYLPSGDLQPGPEGGDPYISVILPNGVLEPGQSISETLVFSRGAPNKSNLTYSLLFLSGQGKL